MGLCTLIVEYLTTSYFVLDQKDDCPTCISVLQSLENIDDDADRQDIRLVKTTDEAFAEEVGITEFPSLVFFFKVT